MFDHGLSRLVPIPAEYSTCFVALSSVFDGVDSVLLRMSRYVTGLSRRVKFKNIKWHIMGTSCFMLEQSL